MSKPTSKISSKKKLTLRRNKPLFCYLVTIFCTSCMYLNLACVNRELHFLHVSKFSMCKQRGEELTHLPITAMATWRRLPHELTQSSVRRFPPPTAAHVSRCSLAAAPFHLHPSKKSKAKKKYRGKSERAQAHYTAAVSSPRRGAHSVSPRHPARPAAGPASPPVALSAAASPCQRAH
jgi:hypothetical protein